MDDFGNCHECGGSDGNHFDDCIFEGTDYDKEYVSYSKRGSSSGKGSTTNDTEKCLIWYLIALVVGYGVNELIGTVIMIGLIIWVATK